MNSEERSNEEIRADLARLGELDAAFRERVAQVKAGQRMPRGGLSDPAASSERNYINARLVADVPSLLARIAAVKAELARADAILRDYMRIGTVEHFASLAASPTPTTEEQA